MDFLTVLGKRSRIISLAAGALLIAAIGYADYRSGYELGVSLFYLIPICVVAWFNGRWFGLASAAACAVVWYVADIEAGHPYSNPFILYWNTGIRLGIFLIVNFLLTALRKSLEHEKQLSRIDPLTGATNGRNFRETLQAEISRSHRYKRRFTIAYIDLDNFKAVNDGRGHSEGDRVLRTVVDEIRGSLRSTDVVARLGGDEFVLLLPETDEAAAHTAVEKIHANLLREMAQRGWPVTFSIGVLTCLEMGAGTDALIRMVDELMYSVKSTGKNAVRFSVCAG